MSNLHFSGFNVVSSHEITHVSCFNQLNPMEIAMFLGYPPRDPTLHRLLHQPRGELRPEQLGAAWTRQGQDAGGGQIQAWDQLQPAWRGNVETYGERNMEKPMERP